MSQATDLDPLGSPGSPSNAAVDTRAPAEARLQLRRIVPTDRMQVLRWVLLGGYLVVYLWWLRARGLPIDRISVTISLAIFLFCAFVGKSWKAWVVLVVDVVLYAAMWLAYEQTRTAAYTLGMPLQVESVRNIDRFLFWGNDPNVVLQQHFWHADVRWWDQVASTIYYTHFVVPIVVIAVLWAANRRQWLRFMRRFATLLAVACVMFVLLPTVPPWMASSRKFNYRLIPQLERKTYRGFYDLGFKGFVGDWQKALEWGNPVAAMPSLHSAFSLIVPAFFLPWLKPKWLKALALCFPVAMLTSLVYLGEHWVIDGLVGWTIVGGSFMLWSRLERWQRHRKADLATAALDISPTAEVFV
jgi:membrane-associated phospholipid phosphatase